MAAALASPIRKFTPCRRAIFTAALKAKKDGISVQPEIMIPLVMTRKELAVLKALVDDVAKEIFAAEKAEIAYQVGTMIELPRVLHCAQAGLPKWPSSSASAPTTSRRPRWASRAMMRRPSSSNIKSSACWNTTLHDTGC